MRKVLTVVGVHTVRERVEVVLGGGGLRGGQTLHSIESTCNPSILALCGCLVFVMNVT